MTARLKACIEAWPDCADGEYNPACCRFPKSCSCGDPQDSGPVTAPDAAGTPDSRSTPGPGQAALPDLEAAFASGLRVRTGPCTVDAHDGDHFQVRTNAHWLCGHLLASVLASRAIAAAAPAPAAHGTLATAIAALRKIAVTGTLEDAHEMADEALEAIAPDTCRTCGGSGTLVVPDSDYESASEQACPDCGPEPECLASHCPPSMHVDCEYPRCAPDSARDALDAQTLHDSPGADL